MRQLRVFNNISLDGYFTDQDGDMSWAHKQFSRTMANAPWINTRLIKADIVDAMHKLKAENGPDMVIMGSGTIVSQFTDARLIDEYQVVLSPIVLGAGRTMFSGVKERNGRWWLSYL